LFFFDLFFEGKYRENKSFFFVPKFGRFKIGQFLNVPKSGRFKNECAQITTGQKSVKNIWPKPFFPDKNTKTGPLRTAGSMTY